MMRKNLFESACRWTSALSRGVVRVAHTSRQSARAPSAFLLLAPLLVGLSTAAVPALAGPGESARQEPAAVAKQPNVLIIVADDLGFADVGFNGGMFATPNIDRVAKLGVTLDRFYTAPLCSPTRAGLLTGRYPHRYGIMGDTITPASDFGLDPGEDTIAAVLGRTGYERRSFIGKWHLGHRSIAYHPMSFGFTSFYGHYNGAIDYFTLERAGQRDWHRDYAPSPDRGYSTDLMTDEAVRIIRTPSPDQSPWLMWVAYNAPHGPLQATSDDLKAAGFDPAAPRYGGGGSAGEGGGYGVQGRGNTRRQTAIAMIGALDRGVGAMLNALRETGQLENTVILFTSDNGGPRQWGPAGVRDMPSSNGPLRGWKFQHYDGGVRVAAAIAWPAHLKPRARAGVGPISYVDVLPTIAALAGAKLNRPVDGEDVSGALLSGRPMGDRTLFLGEDYSVPAPTGERGPTAPEALRGRGGAVLVGRWKLVGSQLFDMEADPYEKDDVAAQHPNIVKRLSAEVARFSALRQVPRQRMNAAGLPPVKLWAIKKGDASGE
jgi:arylsulfatase B